MASQSESSPARMEKVTADDELVKRVEAYYLESYFEDPPAKQLLGLDKED